MDKKNTYLSNFVKVTNHCPFKAHLINNRPRPFDELRHLTPQTKLIDLQILIGMAFSHPLGPKNIF